MTARPREIGRCLEQHAAEVADLLGVTEHQLRAYLTVASRVDLSTRLALTIEEAATALGVSPRHVRNHISDLPHFHLGRCVLLPVDSMRDWGQRQVAAEVADTHDVAREMFGKLRR